MAFRTFLDRAGNDWLVFDVVPRKDERRHYDRRSGRAEQDDSTDDNRRDEHDRRLTVGGGGTLESSQGWLVFEHGNDRRRLSPIPGDWFSCSVDQLEVYREASRQVHVDAPTLTESATRTS